MISSLFLFILCAFGAFALHSLADRVMANWTESSDQSIIAFCNGMSTLGHMGGTTLANTKSAIKRVRQNEKRNARNRMNRSRMRTFVKKARLAIADGDKAMAEEHVKLAVSEIDRAAKKGLIHRNNAARRKSRLVRSFNAM